MAETYAILWQPERGAGDPLARPGTAHLDGERGGTPPAEVLVRELEPRDASDLSNNPRALLLAPAMPISLVVPLAASGSAAADWALAATGADVSTYTGVGVKVAVLDTGIDMTHPAFQGVRLTSRDFSGSGSPEDRNGHGTHCAGTIFGRDINGARIGVARGVTEALVGKVLGDGGNGTSTALFEGLQWAIRERADVISMSFELDFPGYVRGAVARGVPIDVATADALHRYSMNLRMFDMIIGQARAGAAFSGHEPLFVAAAGNGSRRTQGHRIGTGLPGGTPSVVSVGAVGPDGGGYRVADFSNSDPTVSAPGIGILSAAAGGGANTKSGTSMACPHAAGVAALHFEELSSQGSRASAEQVRAKLIATARQDVFPGGEGRVDVGYGLVAAP